MGLNVVTDTIGGLFGGGGGDQGNGQVNDAMNQQIAMNEAQLEQKRQNLYKQRLDIIKSMGNQNWTGARPDPNASATAKPSTPPWFPGFADGMGFINSRKE